MGARFPTYLLLLLTARIDGADRVIHMYAPGRAHAQHTHTHPIRILTFPPVGTPADVRGAPEWTSRLQRER